MSPTRSGVSSRPTSPSLPSTHQERKHDLRSVFNALRWMVRTGTQWRYLLAHKTAPHGLFALPHDFPDWPAVQQQTQRWIDRHCFENLVHDLRELLRLSEGRSAQPTSSIIDSRFVPGTPESGPRTSYNGFKAKKGSKAHAVVDTLGHLLALAVTAGSVDDRKPVEELCEAVREQTGESVRARACG